MRTFSSKPEAPALPGLDEFAAVRGAPPYVTEAVGALSGLPLDGWEVQRSYVRYWPGRRGVVQWTFTEPKDGDQLLASAELRSEAGIARGRNGEGTYLQEVRLTSGPARSSRGRIPSGSRWDSTRSPN